jgi:hypothetical protein
MVSRERSILRSIHWSTRRLNRLWVAIRRRSSFTQSWRTYSPLSRRAADLFCRVLDQAEGRFEFRRHLTRACDKVMPARPRRARRHPNSSSALLKGCWNDARRKQRRVFWAAEHNLQQPRIDMAQIKLPIFETDAAPALGLFGSLSARTTTFRCRTRPSRPRHGRSRYSYTRPAGRRSWSRG